MDWVIALAFTDDKESRVAKRNQIKQNIPNRQIRPQRLSGGTFWQLPDKSTLSF